MHVLITGASKGIGLAIARRFAIESNVSLSLCARKESDIFTMLSEIEQLSPGLSSLGVVCDVSHEAEVAKFAARAESEHGPVDVLVNNAGFGRFGPVLEMRTETFDDQLATNLRGVFLMTQAVLPAMKRSSRGTIVTVSSLAGKNGLVGGSAYCASKFGVRGLMQSLFLDVREFGIRVITIFPGSVDTAFFDSGSTASQLRSKNALRAEAVADSIFAAVTLPEDATISEIDIRPTNPKR